MLLAILVSIAGTSLQADVPTSDNSGLRFLQTLDQRIADVSWRLSSANASICPDRMNAIGVSLHDAAQYSANYRKAAIDTFGFGDGLPAVLAVAAGGPGYGAGLRADDRIVAIDDQPFVPNRPLETGKEDYTSVDAAMSKLERLPAAREVRLDVRRGDRAMTLTVKPSIICRSRVEVVPGGQINANSNGNVVQIYGKLALWTKSEDELAIVVAHEMAHNLLGHNRRIANEKIGTGVLASLGGDGRKLREMEREADRYGLYLVARAGFDYRTAPDFWRHLSGTAGLGAIWATTHPTAANRARFNQGVVDEIAAKSAAGDALVP